MISSWEVKSFLNQSLTIKKKFSNYEISVYRIFYETTKIYPDNIIFLTPYIFFFIKSENYFNAREFLKKLRTQICNKKIMIVNSESTLIKLLFNLFPDTYIHDILLDVNDHKTRVITIRFYFYEDRGIAVGRNGSYIKSINNLFKRFINLDRNDMPLSIKCEFSNVY